MACRSRWPITEMERLGVSDGRLAPDPDGLTPGRGAWVCPKRSCVKKIVKRPGCLFRSLKRKPPPIVTALPEDLVTITRQRCLALLPACQKAGLLVSGPKRILASGGILALITAADASPTSLAPLLAHAHQQGAVSTMNLGLDRHRLGELVHKGPRVAIAILSGRPSLHLMEHLQRHLSLS